MTEHINIYDVSKKAGVSIATVSRVINGTNNVSPKTKAKVLKVIEEFGYTPNVFARGLGTNSMQTIGLLCADSSDPYLAKAIYFLEGTLRQHGYDVLLCCTGYQHETKQKYLELLLAKRVDGLILVGSNYVESQEAQNDYIRRAAKNVPIVIVNACLTGSNIYCSLCDDYQGIYDVTTQCIQAGISDILYLYSNLSYSGRQKLAGYQKALEDQNITVNANLMHQITGTDALVHQVRDRLLDLDERGISFRAVITANDMLAVGAVKYALLTKRSIPRDVMVIGYNNSAIAEYCIPEISSVDNKLQEICKQSIQLLLEVLRGNSVPKKAIFSATLVERETSNIKNLTQ